MDDIPLPEDIPFPEDIAPPLPQCTDIPADEVCNIQLPDDVPGAETNEEEVETAPTVPAEEEPETTVPDKCVFTERHELLNSRADVPVPGESEHEFYMDTDDVPGMSTDIIPEPEPTAEISTAEPNSTSIPFVENYTEAAGHTTDSAPTSTVAAVTVSALPALTATPTAAVTAAPATITGSQVAYSAAAAASYMQYSMADPTMMSHAHNYQYMAANNYPRDYVQMYHANAYTNAYSAYQGYNPYQYSTSMQQMYDGRSMTPYSAAGNYQQQMLPTNAPPLPTHSVGQTTTFTPPPLPSEFSAAVAAYAANEANSTFKDSDKETYVQTDSFPNLEDIEPPPTEPDVSNEGEAIVSEENENHQLEDEEGQKDTTVMENESEETAVKATEEETNNDSENATQEDINRYSPSLPMEEDETNHQSENAENNAQSRPPAKPSSVLGIAQAKKRLMAFSISKQAAAAQAEAKKKAQAASANSGDRKENGDTSASKGLDESHSMSEHNDSVASAFDDKHSKKRSKRASKMERARETIEEIEEIKRSELMFRDTSLMHRPNASNDTGNETSLTETDSRRGNENEDRRKDKNSRRRSPSYSRSRNRRRSRSRSYDKKSKRSGGDSRKYRRRSRSRSVSRTKSRSRSGSRHGDRKPEVKVADLKCWSDFKEAGLKLDKYRRIKLDENPDCLMTEMEYGRKELRRRGRRSVSRDRRGTSMEKEIYITNRKKKMNLLDSPMVLKQSLFTYSRDSDEQVEFPSHMMQFTDTKPIVKYCENPRMAKRHFISRAELIDTTPDDISPILSRFWNSIRSKRFKIKPTGNDNQSSGFNSDEHELHTNTNETHESERWWPKSPLREDTATDLYKFVDDEVEEDEEVLPPLQNETEKQQVDEESENIQKQENGKEDVAPGGSRVAETGGKFFQNERYRVARRDEKDTFVEKVSSGVLRKSRFEDAAPSAEKKEVNVVVRSRWDSDYEDSPKRSDTSTEQVLASNRSTEAARKPPAKVSDESRFGELNDARNVETVEEPISSANEKKRSSSSSSHDKRKRKEEKKSRKLKSGFEGGAESYEEADFEPRTGSRASAEKYYEKTLPLSSNKSETLAGANENEDRKLASEYEEFMKMVSFEPHKENEQPLYEGPKPPPRLSDSPRGNETTLSKYNSKPSASSKKEKYNDESYAAKSEDTNNKKDNVDRLENNLMETEEEFDVDKFFLQEKEKKMKKLSLLNAAVEVEVVKKKKDESEASEDENSDSKLSKKRDKKEKKKKKVVSSKAKKDSRNKKSKLEKKKKHRSSSDSSSESSGSDSDDSESEDGSSSSSSSSSTSSSSSSDGDSSSESVSKKKRGKKRAKKVKKKKGKEKRERKLSEKRKKRKKRKYQESDSDEKKSKHKKAKSENAKKRKASKKLLAAQPQSENFLEILAETLKKSDVGGAGDAPSVVKKPSKEKHKKSKKKRDKDKTKSILELIAASTENVVKPLDLESHTADEQKSDRSAGEKKKRKKLKKKRSTSDSSDDEASKSKQKKLDAKAAVAAIAAAAVAGDGDAMNFLNSKSNPFFEDNLDDWDGNTAAVSTVEHSMRDDSKTLLQDRKQSSDDEPPIKKKKRKEEKKRKEKRSAKKKKKEPKKRRKEKQRKNSSSTAKLSTSKIEESVGKKKRRKRVDGEASEENTQSTDFAEKAKKTRDPSVSPKEGKRLKYTEKTVPGNNVTERYSPTECDMEEESFFSERKKGAESTSQDKYPLEKAMAPSTNFNTSIFPCFEGTNAENAMCSTKNYNTSVIPIPVPPPTSQKSHSESSKDTEPTERGVWQSCETLPPESAKTSGGYFSRNFAPTGIMEIRTKAAKKFVQTNIPDCFDRVEEAEKTVNECYQSNEKFRGTEYESDAEKKSSHVDSSSNIMEAEESVAKMLNDGQAEQVPSKGKPADNETISKNEVSGEKATSEDPRRSGSRERSRRKEYRERHGSHDSRRRSSSRDRHRKHRKTHKKKDRHRKDSRSRSRSRRRSRGESKERHSKRRHSKDQERNKSADRVAKKDRYVSPERNPAVFEDILANIKVEKDERRNERSQVTRHASEHDRGFARSQRDIEKTMVMVAAAAAAAEENLVFEPSSTRHSGAGAQPNMLPSGGSEYDDRNSESFWNRGNDRTLTNEPDAPGISDLQDKLCQLRESLTTLNKQGVRLDGLENVLSVLRNTNICPSAEGQQEEEVGDADASVDLQKIMNLCKVIQSSLPQDEKSAEEPAHENYKHKHSSAPKPKKNIADSTNVNHVISVPAASNHSEIKSTLHERTREISPKPLSLDERLELELGVKKSTPVPQTVPTHAGTVNMSVPPPSLNYYQVPLYDPNYPPPTHQNYPHMMQPHHIDRNYYAAPHHQPMDWSNPESYIGQNRAAMNTVQHPMMVQPQHQLPPSQRMVQHGANESIGQNHYRVSDPAGSKVHSILVGNVLQIVPTEIQPVPPSQTNKAQTKTSQALPNVTQCTTVSSNSMNTNASSVNTSQSTNTGFSSILTAHLPVSFAAAPAVSGSKSVPNIKSTEKHVSAVNELKNKSKDLPPPPPPVASPSGSFSSNKIMNLPLPPGTPETEVKKLLRLAKEKRKEEKVLQKLLKVKGLHKSPITTNSDDNTMLEEHVMDENEESSGVFSIKPSPEQGILISPGFKEKSTPVTPLGRSIIGSSRKMVSFVDGVRPGSSSLVDSPSCKVRKSSPPPNAGRKKHKVRVKIIRPDESDDDDSPPPPPPGPPPPELYPPIASMNMLQHGYVLPKL